MTADELARVTAERDAAVAALARVEALAEDIAFEQGDLGNDTILLRTVPEMIRRALQLEGPGSTRDERRLGR